MDWYFMNGDKQEGPVEQDRITELIQSGQVTGNTPVWRDGMGDWLQLSQTELAPLIPSIKAPPRFTGTSMPPPPPVFTSSTSFARDPEKIYPSNPPKSPHTCWWGILIVGLPHFILGQTAKGAVFFTAAFILGILTAGISALVFVPINIIDSYQVGKVLASGRPVGKWDFFPS
jgi:GYF domain 2